MLRPLEVLNQMQQMFIDDYQEYEAVNEHLKGPNKSYIMLL